MEEIVRVGFNRLPVIIGVNGQTKSAIEKRTDTLLDIDSHTGDIIVTSGRSYYEIHIAKKIITAIARGFSPDNAFKLLKDDYAMESVLITDFTKDSKSRGIQLKGRIIGKEGRIKMLIEKKNNCSLSIYGKTISIIGKQADVESAKAIVERLLSGARHAVVFNSIDRSKKDNTTDNSSEDKIDDIDFDDG